MSEQDFLQELQSADAARWIAAMGDVASADLSDAAFARVADLVAHPNESAREAALYCLTDKPDTRAIPFLIAVARSGECKDNPYETLSYYAFSRLGDLQDESILNFYVQRVNEDRLPPEFHFHTVVARGLGAYDTEVAVDALLRLAKQDDHYLTQRDVADSLLKLNRPRLASYWAEVAERRKDPVVKAIARQALRRLRSKILHQQKGRPLRRLRSQSVAKGNTNAIIQTV